MKIPIVAFSVIFFLFLLIPSYADTVQMLSNTTHNKMYYGTSGTSQLPSSATTEYNDAGYANANTSNNVRNTITAEQTSLQSKYNNERYTFNLSSFMGSVTMANINWVQYCHEGYYLNAFGDTYGSLTIKYYNTTNSTWLVDQTQGTSEAVKCKNFTSNTSFNGTYNATNGLFQFGITCRASATLDLEWTDTECYTDFANLTISYTVADATPPTFSNPSINTTCAGKPVNISITISDETALSGFIFSTNNTGTWRNTTWASKASGQLATNITTLNSTVGKIVNYTWYANDSSNNWGTRLNSTTTTDCASPTVTISSPTNTTYVADGTWFNVTLNEAGSWCGRSLDKTANVSMVNSTGNWNNYTTGIAKGSHNVTFCCNDTSNNMNCSAIQYFTIDNTPPTYNIVGTNNSNPPPLAQVLHYANWSDNIGLSGYIFSWNATGTLCNEGFANDTWLSFSGVTWSNVTKQVPLVCAGKVIDFLFYANDTSNNWNKTVDMTENESTSYPQWIYGSNSTNSTLRNTSISHNLEWNDTVGLSGYIFSWTNETVTCSSETIILNESNSGNIGDTYTNVNSPDVNYGNTTYFYAYDNIQNMFLLFNLSVIPDDVNITNANISIYCYSVAISDNVSAFNTTNNWNETNLTWNTRPSADIYQDSIITGILDNPPNSQYFNITDAVISTFTSANKNISIMLNSSIQQTAWRTKEYGESGKRPQLIINYNNCSVQTWHNDTWESMTGLTNWSNYTKTFDEPAGTNISWKIYSNNSVNNWNVSDIFSYTLTENITERTKCIYFCMPFERIESNPMIEYYTKITLFNYFCHQESTNETNQSGIDGNCGLNYIGNYTLNGWAFEGVNTVDGSYATGDFSGNLTIFYRKPINSFYGSIWQINPYTDIFNVSIPNDCWDLSNDYIGFHVESIGDINGNNSLWYCYNNTGLKLLYNYTHYEVSNGNSIAEESVFWNIGQNNDILLNENERLSISYMTLDDISDDCIIYWYNKNSKDQNLCVNLNSKKTIYLRRLYEDNTGLVDWLMSVFNDIFG